MTQRTALRRRPVFWLGAVILVAALAGAGYGFWYLFLKPSGPPPVSISNVPLPSSSASATSSSGTSAASASGTGLAGPSSATTGSTAGLDGTWKVDQSLGSFVGYRVQEQLASIGANTAVGRTPDVAGSMTLRGSTVTAAEFTADLTTLKSDDDRRDGQLARQGIQTSRFPNATFKLTQPIDLGSLPADGQSISVTATGDFTLHGVTQSVQIALQAKRSKDVIAVTGSLPILFADYGVQKPNSFVVLSIDDHGTMELQLLFTKG